MGGEVGGVGGAYRLFHSRSYDVSIAQRSESVYVKHHFWFAENTESVPQTFAHEDTTEAHTFQQNTAVPFRYKDKDCMKDVTFIRSIVV